jgi:cystathionine beta-lyase/cystathionine gamma-synthase
VTSLSKEPVFDFATRALHGDRDMDLGTNVAPSLHQSVTHFSTSGEDFALKASEPLNDQFYARHGNPTSSRLARILADLERGESAMIMSSGMGAIATTVLALVSSGDHVIAQSNHYIGTTNLLTHVLPRFGVEVTQVDQRNLEEFRQAVRPNSKLIIVETPVNPTMHLTDLAGVAAIARDHGILTLCDNTVATPFLQRPLELGIDVCLHSATKYIGGHHDLLAGAVISTKSIVDRIWDMSMTLGPIPAPFNAWLALRGVRTLKLRMQQHCASTLTLAEYLSTHPKIETVNYPGLPAHPQYELARRQMTNFGGLLSYEVAGGYEGGRRFIEALKLPLNAGSLGGIDSLVIQPAAMWGGRLPDEVVKSQGVRPGLIRMAVGIEDTADLLTDLKQALDHV